MKAILVALLLATGGSARADYTSAARAAKAATDARNAQWREERTRKAQAQEKAALNAVVRRHGGYAAGPSEVPNSQDGSYNVIAFATRDGWECEAFAGSLRCANAGLGKKFDAQRWLGGGRKNLSVYTGSWDYTDVLSACEFFGYPRPRASDIGLGT